METKKEKEYWELVVDLKVFNSTLSFKNNWNTEVLLEWT